MKLPRRFYEESVREKSDKKVKKSSKRLGARITPNSGATKIKGDLRLGEFLIEHKYTEKNSYRIDDVTWHKVLQEAIVSNKEPVMEIETASAHYFVVPAHIFERLNYDATEGS